MITVGIPDILFDIKAGRESDKGYCDIVLASRRGDVPGLIMEMKHSKDGRSNLDRLASDAIAQIHDRRYYHGLKGRILIYGMSFHSMDSRVVSEELLL